MQYLEVPKVDWAEGLIYDEGTDSLKKWRTDIWEKTVKYIKRNLKNIDVFLSYLYPKQIDESAIKVIKELGIPCVNFYCDNVRQFRAVPKQFRGFDLIWVPEVEANAMYQKEHIPFINLPMPMWVEPRLRSGITPSNEPKVSFIGSRDILRAHLLGEAINLGLDISIRGSGWMGEESQTVIPSKSPFKTVINQFTFIHQHGIKGWLLKKSRRNQLSSTFEISPSHIFPQPGFEDYISLTQNSEITIGVNRVPTYKLPNSHPLVYSRLRDIEAPMLGACYVTEYCEGLETLYDLGKDILTYKTAAELVEHCNYLLKDPAKSTELRKNGQHKALTEHAIPASLKKLRKALFK